MSSKLKITVELKPFDSIAEIEKDFREFLDISGYEDYSIKIEEIKDEVQNPNVD